MLWMVSLSMPPVVSISPGLPAGDLLRGAISPPVGVSLESQGTSLVRPNGRGYGTPTPKTHERGFPVIPGVTSSRKHSGFSRKTAGFFGIHYYDESKK
jgi:hypothetical protein